jgi:ABC-type cobalamin/Fe3+-siderophores transport systems, ATPase components
LIETNNIGVTLSKKRIVDQICIHVDEGEFVGVIGPNGSGKSTLLKTIYRILKPTDGSIVINNRNLRDLSLRESAVQTSVVAQHNHYNFDFKVKDIVMMGRSPHKRAMEMDNEEDHRIVKDVP